MVDWDFIWYMMGYMGFGYKWRGWIKTCVSSTKFSVLINGSPKGFFFKSSRGLHQGNHSLDFLLRIRFCR